MRAISSKTRTAVLVAAALLVAASGAMADDAPAWLKQAAGRGAPAYDKSVSAVVLMDDQQTTLSSDSKMTVVQNYAVKILTREGKRRAVAQAYYLVSSGRIKDIRGWLIRPDGSTKAYDKNSVLDIIADTDDVYNEGRVRLIDASNDVDEGYVFGYTVESEDSPLFYQDSWAFQDRLPTVYSRYALTLPQGWSANSLTFNSPATITPQVTGSTYTWEMRDLKPIPVEPMSPSVANLSPRIVVNYGPASGKTENRTFTSWEDVSRWATQLHDTQVVVDDNVAGKARELTAGAETELDKIRAVGKYVQSLQYISIDIGVGHGNGYKPRSSTLVLSRGYGDCKDKANLMRALLKSLRIEAYPIAIYSGDPAYVREQFPSPVQFNHCIIAIKVSDATKTPTVIDHPKLGRLLIFDATDPYTPVGSLPSYLQGSYALIAAGDNGGLAKMPATQPEADMLERTVEASVSPTGAIKGTISEKANGQTATMFRREVRELSPADYRKGIEAWLTGGATGAHLGELKSTDRFFDAGFDLSVGFDAPMYGQLMQGRLLVFKPVIVGRRQEVPLTEATRTSPIETTAWSMKETATFSLPEGFVVDETPSPMSLDTAFGKYSTTYAVEGSKLVFTRTMTLNRSQVPVEKYESVRKFFAQIREAEQSPVVLMKK